MGYPDGWVTEPAIGLSRTQTLKLLGNAVQPQCAYAAYLILLDRFEEYWCESAG